MKEISKEAREKIKNLFSRYPDKRSSLLEVLHILQDDWGYIEEEDEEKIAELLDMNPVNVHEVVTFYTMYYRRPVGRYVIKVCRNLTCTLMGGETIINYLRKKLKVELGNTSSDGKFTLEAVECLGACELAPVMEINGEFYGHLTPEKIDKVIEELK